MEELEIHFDGKTLKQRDSLVYLGGAIYGDGNSGTDVRRRITAGANAWREVEGMVGDRGYIVNSNETFSPHVSPRYTCTA